MCSYNLAIEIVDHICNSIVSGNCDKPIPNESRYSNINDTHIENSLYLNDRLFKDCIETLNFYGGTYKFFTESQLFTDAHVLGSLMRNHVTDELILLTYNKEMYFNNTDYLSTLSHEMGHIPIFRKTILGNNIYYKLSYEEKEILSELSSLILLYSYGYINTINDINNCYDIIISRIQNYTQNKLHLKSLTGIIANHIDFISEHFKIKSLDSLEESILNILPVRIDTRSK